MSKLVKALCFGILFTLVAHSASAGTIIGSFRYEEDPFAGTGGVTLENLAASGSPFENVVVTLTTSDFVVDSTTEFGYGVLSLGDMPTFIGNYSQLAGFTFAPLLAFDFGTIPIDIFWDVFVSASVSLTFEGIDVLDTPGIDPFNTSADVAIAPEPATLLLLGSGAVAALVRRRLRTRG